MRMVEKAGCDKERATVDSAGGGRGSVVPTLTDFIEGVCVELSGIELHESEKSKGSKVATRLANLSL